MDLGLADQIALVTGASGAIGAAIARALAAEGTRVALGCHSGRDAAEQVLADIERAGGAGLIVRHDLNDPASIDAAVDTIIRRWGGLDVLVASAWVQPAWPAPRDGGVEPSPPEVWQEQLRTNTEGTARCIHAVLPVMKARGGGRIVLVSSGAAEDGAPGLEAYAAAKAALHGLNRSLAHGLGRAGILTNVVMPGFIATGRHRQIMPAAVVEHLASLSPTGRLATEDEVARAVVFLAAPANRSVTGATIRVGSGLYGGL
jgi:3-oxoacyl-[acyl-carrier protein] reductase